MSVSRVPLSSIGFAIGGVSALDDSHCIHIKLIPLFHHKFAIFPFEWYSCYLFIFVTFLCMLCGI